MLYGCTVFFYFPWRFMVFATVGHGTQWSTMAIRSVSRTAMVLHGNAMRMPWHSHGLPWCATSPVLGGIAIIVPHGIATDVYVCP